MYTFEYLWFGNMEHDPRSGSTVGAKFFDVFTALLFEEFGGDSNTRTRFREVHPN